MAEDAESRSGEGLSASTKNEGLDDVRAGPEPARRIIKFPCPWPFISIGEAAQRVVRRLPIAATTEPSARS